MPSKTYYNLPSEKKEKLITAAKKEFSRTILSAASINKIIKDAGISRGSFYAYFKDIEDLYSFVLREYRINGIYKLLEITKINNGDLLKSIKKLFSLFTNYCIVNEEKQFFKNIFKNTNLYIEGKTFKNEDDKEIKALFLELENIIDKKKLSKEARENLYYTIRLLLDITMKSIIPCIMFDENQKQTEEHFMKMIKLIEGGISK